jgi:hypothetical protein
MTTSGFSLSPNDGGKSWGICHPAGCGAILGPAKLPEPVEAARKKEAHVPC